MSHDPLSDVLRSVRLRGAVFYYVSFGGDWVAETPASPELARALMPGADHVLAYHLLVKGRGWAACDGHEPVLLAAGDIVMFPRGDAHAISSAPGLHANEDHSDWRVTTRDDPKPIDVAYHRGVLRPGAPGPAEEASSVVVCGFVACDMKPFNPLIAALPHQLHLRGDDLGPWTVQLLDQAVAESRAHRAGSAAVLERASEFVFVDAARRYLDRLPPDAAGWLAALRDRHVGRAIALMHERPAHDWSVDELGRAVGLSRSALHERFTLRVGLAPMQYLAHWRMQLGAGLLRLGRIKVAAVAQEVGYESEAAFARAFKRLMGQPPAAWRRAQRDVGDDAGP
ncbi:MAG: AraC family transcriptional regulator [Burkholderiales bacterium]|nr:AraC family transcriptional regulator [Burkholderiales bacterium]MDE1928636.1 AraC family transcriptional regulator [Burkholderiales bacterium]MDE2160012.1 AraC family transcriptional regulator [Burkholderiales bacterium]MDE2504878.1 AraC family transcriptional regulator [Burkholderiales bacterium]